MNDVSNKFFRSSDLAFCSYLSAIGVSLISTERSAENSDKMVWVFEISGADLMRAKAGFYGSTATVVALRYSDAMRHLKSMIYS
jgi:hypothetical protein